MLNSVLSHSIAGCADKLSNKTCIWLIEESHHGGAGLCNPSHPNHDAAVGLCKKTCNLCGGEEGENKVSQVARNNGNGKDTNSKSKFYVLPKALCWL